MSYPWGCNLNVRYIIFSLWGCISVQTNQPQMNFAEHLVGHFITFFSELSWNATYYCRSKSEGGAVCHLFSWEWKDDAAAVLSDAAESTADSDYGSLMVAITHVSPLTMARLLSFLIKLKRKWECVRVRWRERRRKNRKWRVGEQKDGRDWGIENKRDGEMAIGSVKIGSRQFNVKWVIARQNVATNAKAL